MSDSEFISVAKILNFHGIKGEARVGYSVGNENKLKTLKSFFVFFQNQYLELKIKSLKFHKNFAIIKFKNIDTINDIVKFKGLNLYIKKSLVIENLEEDEYLISQLTGLKVYDKYGLFLGIVDEIAENKASSLLSVRYSEDNKLYFVPFVKQLVLKVDLDEKFIVIDNIEGLIGQ